MKKLISSLPALAALAAANANPQERYANAAGVMAPAVYTGANDPTIVIPGQVKNFALEGHINQQFSFTITNVAGSARFVQLFAGYNTGNLTARPGQLTDGVFNDIDGDAGLSAASTQARVRIAEMQQFFKENPTRVVRMRIQTNVEAQLLNTIECGKLDIFRSIGSETIYPATFIDSNSFNKDIVVFDTDLQIDDRSDIITTIAANSITTYTLYCGATLDKSNELQVKAAAGKAGAQMLY